MHIDEQRYLCPREQLVNHDGDALAEVDLVLDVVLVLEALLRFEVAHELREHNDDQRFMLHALPALEADAVGLPIFLWCVRRQFFRIEESSLDRVACIEELLGLRLDNLDFVVAERHLSDRVARDKALGRGEQVHTLELLP